MAFSEYTANEVMLGVVWIDFDSQHHPTIGHAFDTSHAHMRQALMPEAKVCYKRNISATGERSCVKSVQFVYNRASSKQFTVRLTSERSIV